MCYYGYTDPRSIFADSEKKNARTPREILANIKRGKKGTESE